MISDYNPRHSLSILADRASVGLSLLRARGTLDDVIRGTINDGIRFCSVSMESPLPLISANVDKDESIGLNSVMAYGPHDHAPDNATLIEHLAWLKAFFVELSNNELPSQGDLDRAQDQLHVLARAYYDAALRAMRKDDTLRGLQQTDGT